MEEMVNIVRNGFDPLAQRLRLRGPTVVLKNTYFQLGYFGDVIGLEILVEFGHFFVLAMPFRMKHRDELPNGFVGPTRVVREMYLQAALDKLRIRYESEQSELKPLGGDYRNCSAMTSITVALVERTWAAIRENADQLFPT